MGNELKRDVCPQKYYGKSSLIKDSLATLVAIFIVAFVSGSFFNKSGISIAVTIVIEAFVVILMYGFVFFLFKGVKARLAQTFISVCENGVCGVCPQNGYKNKNFEIFYNEITRMVVKGDRLVLSSYKGVVSLMLENAQGTAAVIRSKNPML